MTVETTLGNKIKTLRKDKGLTIAELAELTESGTAYLWNIENRPSPQISARKVLQIAHGLEVTMDYLFDDTASIDIDDAVDQHFYREYLQMPDNIKEIYRKIINILNDI